MFKERFWVMVGMVAVYFVIQMVYGFIGMILLGGTFAALGAAAGGLESGAVAGGIGVGAIVMLIIFYVGYIVLMLAQQGSLMSLATPLRRLDFGEALKTGFRCVLPFFLVTLLLVVAYLAFALVAGGLSYLIGEIAGTILALVMFPLIFWVGLRLSVLVPVIAVDGTHGPIDAIKRTWNMTAGKALGIFVVYLVIILIAIVLLAIPFFLMFGAVFGAMAGGDPSEAAVAGAIGGILLGFLAFIPAMLVYTVASTAIIASIHGEITDTRETDAQDTFG